MGGEAADFVPFFYNYGVNTIILRNRLRRDGYNPQTDAVNDAMQAIRMVRAYAKEWNIDPNKIGIMGFSAGAELARPGGCAVRGFRQEEQRPVRSARGHHVAAGFRRASSTRARRRSPAIARLRRFRGMFRRHFSSAAARATAATRSGRSNISTRCWRIGVPNIEMHIYGNGRHPGDALPDGSRMSGGLTDRNDMPFGTWQYRFIDWFRDLGFLQKPGVETKAAKDITTYMSQPLPGAGRGGAGRGQ